jgi:hypothetical protein
VYALDRLKSAMCGRSAQPPKLPDSSRSAAAFWQW